MSIACLLVPNLALTSELVSRPHLLARPVALTDQRGLRVLQVTPEAARRAVRPGMLLREATALCPSLAIIEQRPARITRAAEQLIESVAAISPLVEPVEPGLVLADLRGLEGLYPNPTDLERALLNAAPAALGPRLGIAEERFTAIVAAHAAQPVPHRAGGASENTRNTIAPFETIDDAPSAAIRVPPDSQTRDVGASKNIGDVGASGSGPGASSNNSATFLAGRPAALLPLPEAALWQLKLFGIDTIGQYAQLPRHAAAAQFGAPGDRAWLAARGQDPTPVHPRPFEHERVIERSQSEPPLVSRETMALHARQLLQRALRQPRARQRFVRQLRLRAITEDDRLWERTQTLREPTGDRHRLWLVIQTMIEYAELPGLISELELELSGLTAEQARQPGLFQDHAHQREQLDQMVRQLKTRFGRSPITQIVEVEPWSRLPERRYALMDYDP
jgi:nucleotidyltransferase/DNA polymerase involved in DNA repair